MKVVIPGAGAVGRWGDGVFQFQCDGTFPNDEADYVIVTSKSRDTEEICRQFQDTAGAGDQ